MTCRIPCARPSGAVFSLPEHTEYPPGYSAGHVPLIAKSGRVTFTPSHAKATIVVLGYADGTESPSLMLKVSHGSHGLGIPTITEQGYCETVNMSGLPVAVPVSIDYTLYGIRPGASLLVIDSLIDPYYFDGSVKALAHGETKDIQTYPAQIGDAIHFSVINTAKCAPVTPIYDGADIHQHVGINTNAYDGVDNVSVLFGATEYKPRTVSVGIGFKPVDGSSIAFWTGAWVTSAMPKLNASAHMV